MKRHKVYKPLHQSEIAFQPVVNEGMKAQYKQFGNLPSISQIKHADVAHIAACIRAKQPQIGVW